MRIVLAATLLALAGCSSHDNKAATSTDPNVVLASSGAHGGCSSGAVTASAEPKVEMASMDGKSCHAPKGEMASADGAKKCSTVKAELASDEGAKKCSTKGEMASVEGAKKCSTVKGELASAEGKPCHAKGELASADGHAKGVTLASAESHPACGECPSKADGSCDHEAGAKAGRQCCIDKLAKTATP